MILGAAVCYTFGTVWLSYQADLSMSATCFRRDPFIPADLVKIIIVLLSDLNQRKIIVQICLKHNEGAVSKYEKCNSETVPFYLYCHL